MKILNLSTQGLSSLVDDEDYENLSKFKWHANKRPNNIYVMRVSRKGERVKKTKLYLHRLIMKCPDNLIVDHINNNGLDNRKENLRLVTPLQNQGNRRKIKIGESKFKGVRKTKHGKFRAYVRRNKENINLGTFKTEIEAAQSYNNYAIKYFKEYAKINKI